MNILNNKINFEITKNQIKSLDSIYDDFKSQQLELKEEKDGLIELNKELEKNKKEQSQLTQQLMEDNQKINSLNEVLRKEKESFEELIDQFKENIRDHIQ
jgi:predicted  nucleic acid-binding Zn-ribbon protein